MQLRRVHQQDDTARHLCAEAMVSMVVADSPWLHLRVHSSSLGAVLRVRVLCRMRSGLDLKLRDWRSIDQRSRL